MTTKEQHAIADEADTIVIGSHHDNWIDRIPEGAFDICDELNIDPCNYEEQERIEKLLHDAVYNFTPRRKKVLV